MIVEDDPMVASVNETYLSRLPGFCVIAKAADGLQALEKIKALSGSVDLVLLDVFMPKMDRLSFLEHLKNLAPSVSVIMITASQNKESLRTALAHGLHHQTLHLRALQGGAAHLRQTLAAAP